MGGKLKIKSMFLSGLTAAAIIGLSGCSAIPLKPGAEQVMVTNAPASAACKFLGSATANQGNFFTGAYTSNKNLQAGAFNDLRNQAVALGGNRVVLLMTDAASTSSSNIMSAGIGGNIGGSGGGIGEVEGGSSGQETNVALTGNVFNCPNQ